MRIPVQAGITIVKCPEKRCVGHMSVPITLGQAAKIRCGDSKIFSPNFTCVHNETIKRVVVEVR
jgi:hypothetical protein